MKITSILLVLFGIILGSCTRVPYPPKKIENVSRIMMHTPTSYSFLVYDTTTKELMTETMSWSHQSPQPVVQFLCDMPDSALSWVYYTSHTTKISGGFNYDSIIVHMHAPNEIEGAGWDHGKFGSGQTHVIE